MHIILACLLSAVVLQTTTLVDAKPYTIQYRNPTREELLNNSLIRVSDKPISEIDTSVEKRVVEYLVEKNYLRQAHLDRWGTLKSLNILTARQSQRMIQLKSRDSPGELQNTLH
jgi:hypothetical protein